ncbi:hypothetical protein [Vibrio nitrifigilis]|uniref:Uncharacterized protein n=1 Tax=Vibrio nitrifigilis TaxID=2789781 RepID=A0ABS0GBA4_9VIBR|nr:hypothetical protein [Vibrio nitrifigilis]MBF8999687.1 hypothetical protein [Vibrio nitrifigilis]
MNTNVLSLSDYGFFLISPEKMKQFLKEKRIRGKKILTKLNEHNDLYLESLKFGAWLPIVEVDAIDYTMIFNRDECVENWAVVCEVGEFNLSVGSDNEIWLGSLISLDKWDANNFKVEDDVISYSTFSGEVLNKFIRYRIKEGEYKVKISSLKRSRSDEYGFYFDFKEVDFFDCIIDPRDENYDFNIK